MVMLDHLATDGSLPPATYQDVRFGTKFIFSSKIEIIDGIEALNLRLGSSTLKSFPFLFLPFFTYRYEGRDSGHNVWLENITFCE
jgi:hypothetical protein